MISLAARSSVARRLAPAVQCALVPKATAQIDVDHSIDPSSLNHTAFLASRRWQSTKNADDGLGQHALGERNDKNLLQRWYDRYSVKQQTRKIFIAEKMLQAAVHQASDLRWFGPGRLDPKDFRTYQAILTMHVWFLHKRLISEKSSDPHMALLVQEELFDILWTDTTNRMRSHGVGEWLMDKNLKIVQQYTFMHCFHYDHCYTELLDKPKERFEELKHLICRHILMVTNDKDDEEEENDDVENEDVEKPLPGRLPSSITKSNKAFPKGIVSEDQVERIAWYIEAQYQNIMHDMPDEYFQEARVAWVDLPDFSQLKDANDRVMPDQPIDTNEVLPKPWIRNIANDGKYYYWHRVNRTAQWERPEK